VLALACVAQAAQLATKAMEKWWSLEKKNWYNVGPPR